MSLTIFLSYKDLKYGEKHTGHSKISIIFEKHYLISVRCLMGSSHYPKDDPWNLADSLPSCLSAFFLPGKAVGFSHISPPVCLRRDSASVIHECDRRGKAKKVHAKCVTTQS